MAVLNPKPELETPESQESLQPTELDWLMRLFHEGWILLGISGLFIGMLTGCGAQPTAQAGQAGAPGSARDFLGFVRVDRGFFDQPLVGSVRVEAAGEAEAREVDSAVRWDLLPPRGQPPREGALADFRDQEGCLTYEAAGSARLCVTVMPDVSSVDFKAGRLKVDGIEAFAAPGCTDGSVRFVDAEKRGDSLEVNFVLSGCASEPVKVRFGLRSS